MTEDERQAMIDEIVNMFGIAKKEKISENSYEFEDKQQQMKEDYEWLMGQDELNNPSARSTRKRKEGYDY